MKGFVVALLMAIVVTAGPARAQVIPPIAIQGPAQGAMQQLHPPSPLQQVREQALRQSPPLPVPPPAGERWVPTQERFVPEVGRVMVVPGHYEQRLTDQQYAVPPLAVTDRTTGFTATIPGGDRPPPDLRRPP